MSDTELIFLGTGTSQGVPIVGCGCEVCRSTDPRDKRLRTSALVRMPNRKGRQVTMVIDSGPDFRYQMLRAGVSSLDAILYTHEHMDHLGGMDDVRAFNYVLQRPIDIWCEPRVEKTLRRIYDYAFAEPKYPGVPDVTLHSIGSDSEPFSVFGVEVMPVRGMHYKLPVLGYRFGKKLCYLTDMNAISATEIEKIRGVEVLVINALRRKPHLSHFTLDEALAVIREVAPTRAYLTHISHQMARQEELEKELPEGVSAAYDGLKVCI